MTWSMYMWKMPLLILFSTTLLFADVHDSFFDSYSTLRPIQGRLDGSKADFVAIWQMYMRGARDPQKRPEDLKEIRNLYTSEKEKRLQSGPAAWLERDFPHAFPDPDFRIIYGEMIAAGGDKADEAMAFTLYKTLNKDMNEIAERIQDRRDELEKKPSLEMTDDEKSELDYLIFAGQSLAKVKNHRETGLYKEGDSLLAAYKRAEEAETARLAMVQSAKDGDEEAKKWLLERYSYDYVTQARDTYRRGKEKGDKKLMAEAVDAMKAIFQPIKKDGKIVEWVAVGFKFGNPEEPEVIRLTQGIEHALAHSNLLDMALAFDQTTGPLDPIEVKQQEREEDIAEITPDLKGSHFVSTLASFTPPKKKEKRTPTQNHGTGTNGLITNLGGLPKTSEPSTKTLINKALTRCTSCHKAEGLDWADTLSEIKDSVDEDYLEEMIPKTGYGGNAEVVKGIYKYFGLTP